jgi:hypothetical protein
MVDDSFEVLHAALDELRNDLRAGFSIVFFLLVILISHFFHVHK